jgi:hypothetical protein
VELGLRKVVCIVQNRYIIILRVSSFVWIRSFAWQKVSDDGQTAEIEALIPVIVVRVSTDVEKEV